MKIGIDARLYRKSTAGIGRYSRNLIKNLLEIDHKNRYVLFMTTRDIEECDLKYPNLKIIKTDIPHYSLAEQTKLAGIIAKEKCDLVHFLNFNHPIRLKGKFIVTIHDLTLFHFPETAKKTNLIKKWAFSKTMKNAILRSAKIIVPSEFTKMDVLKFQKVSPEKITVIYEAADERENPKSEYRNPKLKEGNTILYVGQYREHKNIKRLLEAYKILKKEISCQLVLVGKVPEDYQKIIDNDPDLRDTKRPGFVRDEELAAWYKEAGVFVFPSLYEGFGLPGLEAMAAGLPVASSEKSSLPEIYGDGALYFDPLNPKEIADKIKLVLTDSKIRQELIENGKIVASKYSWQKTAEETLDLYKQIQKS